MISELGEIVLLSLRVSGAALLVSTLAGIPAGVFMGLKRFAGRRLLMALLYTGMGFPPVVIGLFVYLLLSRNGPLAGINWPFLPALFTPGAMISAQTIIAPATPLAGRHRPPGCFHTLDGSPHRGGGRHYRRFWQHHL